MMSMPDYNGLNFLKVFAYKLGFLLCVETLSKSGAAVLGWPLLCAGIVGGIHHFEVEADPPIWLMVTLQAVFLGMWAFKSTTKRLLKEAGEALKLWAGKR